MALEAVVFPQDPFGYGWEEIIYSLGLGGGGPNSSYWGYDFGLQEASKADLETTITEQQLPSRENGETSSPCHQGKEWDLDSSPETPNTATGRGGKRRRRTKDKEQVENQRMTHIAVERNRRKQMNDYLAVLRSLMPPSYVQRGDQASIVGGAINFVKELEQQVQSMEGDDEKKKKTSPFADFFSFPQYTRHAISNASPSSSSSSNKGSADIEVSMADTHASVKIVCKKQPRQLLKMLAAFQRLRLTVLHLNVTTTQHQMVLYSLSLKVEEGSEVNSVDEIAAAVNEMLWRIKEEAACACY